MCCPGGVALALLTGIGVSACGWLLIVS